MINYKAIAIAMKDIVGFRESQNPSDPQLLNSVTKTVSGLYVNDVNTGLINTESMDTLLTQYDNDSELWVAGVYDTNAIVYSNNIYFKAKIDTTEIPESSGTFWDGSATAGTIIYFDNKAYAVLTTTDKNPIESPSFYTEIISDWTPLMTVKTLSDELVEIRTGAINDILSDLVNEKSRLGESKPLVDSFKLYTKVGHYTNTVTKGNRRVGIEINLSDRRGLMFVLKTLRTQFNGNAAFNIQIHTPNSLQPIQSIPINHNLISSFKVTKVTDELMFGADAAFEEIDGTYRIYVSYLESELPTSVSAISRRFNYADFERHSGCGSCSEDVAEWVRVSNFFTVKPFYVNPEHLANDTELWDESNNNYILSTNFGLSFSASVLCDETAVILENINMFASAIQYQTAFKVMQKMAWSTRVSGRGDEIKTDIKNKASFVIENEKSTFVTERSQVREALQNNLKGIEWPCFNPNATASLIASVY